MERFLLKARRAAGDWPVVQTTGLGMGDGINVRFFAHPSRGSIDVFDVSPVACATG